MKKEAYIGVGSNLGDKLANCREAIDLVDNITGCSVVAQSDFFRTSPVGVDGQDWYANNVSRVDSEIPADELLEKLFKIEAGLGRERKEKWGPRTIDLDILLFGNDRIDKTHLTVPHPLMHLRKFVLVPMVQLAPELVHPVLGQTMTELLDGLEEPDQTIVPLNEV